MNCFPAKSLRIGSSFVSFVVAEIYPINEQVTSKKWNCLFSKLSIWTMTEDENVLLPSNVERDFGSILDLYVLMSLLYCITKPFYSLSSTQYLSKTELVVID